MKQNDIESAYGFLLALPRFAIKGNAAYNPGLERIRTLLQHADQPHLRFPSIHIAGTNGKGSAASMIAAILTASGLRVGLHTSPHIHGLEERMRIDGVSAPREWVASAVATAEDWIREVDASFFEATVLLSFMYFAEMAVDVAVVEVGLGGRFDATNVLTPEVAAITDISLEHADILGPTVEGIAREKAGIIKPSVPAITIASGAALSVLSERASIAATHLESARETCEVHDFVAQLTRSRLTLRTPSHEYVDLCLQLPGRHQVWNAALAVRTAEVYADRMHLSVSEEDVRSGLRSVRESTGLTGRLQTVSTRPLIVVDNAHNPQSIEAALAHLSEFGSGRLRVAIGLLKDKDAERIADLLSRTAASVFVVPVAGERAIDTGTLSSLLKGRGLQVDITPSVSDAVDRFRETADARDVLLLTGSHHVVAEALGGIVHRD